MEVLPEPQMHVDLGDFRYVVAERPDSGGTSPGGTDLVALLVSRSADAGFVQLSTIVPPGAAVAAADPLADARRFDGPCTDRRPPDMAPPVLANPACQGNQARALAAHSPRGQARRQWRWTILIFPSGSAALEDEDYASLTALAGWLAANPTRRVVLVGHTDAEGSLAANTALSRCTAPKASAPR